MWVCVEENFRNTMKRNSGIEQENCRLRAEIEELRRQVTVLESALSKSYDHLLRKRDLLIQTVLELDTIQDEPLKVVLEHLRRLPRELQSQIRGIDELNEYELNVLSERQRFTNALIETYPQLSPTEVKICLYINHHRSSKEIAQLLRLSERTVEGHRTSIRSKLGLEAHETLASFLLKFVPTT